MLDAAARTRGKCAAPAGSRMVNKATPRDVSDPFKDASDCSCSKGRRNLFLDARTLPAVTAVRRSFDKRWAAEPWTWPDLPPPPRALFMLRKDIAIPFCSVGSCHCWRMQAQRMHVVFFDVLAVASTTPALPEECTPLKDPRALGFPTCLILLSAPKFPDLLCVSQTCRSLSTRVKQPSTLVPSYPVQT